MLRVGGELQLIVAGGFCAGNFHSLQSEQVPYCCGVRGFKDAVRRISLSTATKPESSIDSKYDYIQKKDGDKDAWYELPKMPGGPRASHKCLTDPKRETMYCVGGFSYTPLTSQQLALMGLKQLPREKKNTLSFRFVQSFSWNALKRAYVWDDLPPIPGRQGVEPGVCMFDDYTMFVMGGADYTRTGQITDGRENVKPYRPFINGQAAWSLNVRNGQKLWTQLPNLPGTHRFSHAVTCQTTKKGVQRVFVIGGCTGGGSDDRGTSYSTVIDNWVYEVNSRRWRRLVDTPSVSGNWPRASLLRNRWIILVGGAGYKRYIRSTKSLNGKHESKVVTLDLNKEEDKALVHPSLRYDDHSLIWNKKLASSFPTMVFGHRAYSNGILVYDTWDDVFFWSDPMPIDINAPQTIFYEEDKMLVVGGESSIGCAFGKAFGRHMDTLLRFEFSIDESLKVIRPDPARDLTSHGFK